METSAKPKHIKAIQEVKNKEGRKFSVSRLKRLYDQGRILTDAYQRRFVDRKIKWNTRLIESLLCGVDIGCIEMVKAEDDNGGFLYYIVDGQHRLFTIMNYLTNHFPLSKNWLTKCDTKLFAKRFDKLPQYGQDRILDSDIYVFTYQENEHHDAASIFLRRNEGNSGLNRMERLNAVWCRSDAYQAFLHFCHQPTWQSFSMRHNMRFDAFRIFLEFLKDTHHYKEGLSISKANQEINFYTEHLHHATEQKVKRIIKATEDFLDLWSSVSEGERWNARVHWVPPKDGALAIARHAVNHHPILHPFFGITFSLLLEEVKKTYLLEHSNLLRKTVKDFISNHFTSFFPIDGDPRKIKMDESVLRSLVEQCKEKVLFRLKGKGVCVDLDTPVSSSLREAILAERKSGDHWIDEISGAKILDPKHIDIDHRLPRSQGGQTTRANLRITHRSLNRSQRYHNA